jgi:hypothetical protein
MFRSRASLVEDFHQAESATFEEDTLKPGVGTFSFFGFNLFEADETLQYDVDDESVADDISIKNSNSESNESYDSAVNAKGTPRRAFWQSLKNKNRQALENDEDARDVGVMTKIKGNLSRTLASIKHTTDLNLAERIRSPSRRGTGKVVVDRVHFQDVDPKYESRDDMERSRGTMNFDSFDSTSRDVYGEEGIADKKCFPSWSLKKNRAKAGTMEPMFTIKEAESINTMNTQYATNSVKQERYTQQYLPTQRHHHHHRSSSGAVGTTRHMPNDQHQKCLRRPRSKPLRSTGTYIKPSNYDDNIWDDQSTSSGWFSLESLDAR